MFSYGFRPGKTHHAVIRKIRKSWFKIGYVIKGHIKNFCTEVDPYVLLFILRKKIRDVKFLQLIWKLLRIKLTSRYALLQASQTGIFCLGVLSSIFTNVYLHALDVYLETLMSKHNLQVFRCFKQRSKGIVRKLFGLEFH